MNDFDLHELFILTEALICYKYSDCEYTPIELDLLRNKLQILMIERGMNYAV